MVPSISLNKIECKQHYILILINKQDNINMFKVRVVDFSFHKDYSIDSILVRKYRYGTEHLSGAEINKTWSLIKYYI